MFAEQFELTEDLRRSDNVLAALIESAIAALVLEHGLDAVAPAVLEAFEGQVEEALHAGRLQDPAAGRGCQARLEGHLQRRRGGGTGHARLFTCAALVAGVPRGLGTGRSKKEAEQAAAAVALASSGHVEDRVSWACPRDCPLDTSATAVSVGPPCTCARSRFAASSRSPSPSRCARAGRGRRRRPQRIGQVEHRRRAALGLAASRPVSCVPRSRTTCSSPEAPLAREPYCEVELRFDDVGGALPGLDFEEVSIARRLHRGGEGQYLVNGATVRRADGRAARGRGPRARGWCRRRPGQGGSDPRVVPGRAAGARGGGGRAGTLQAPSSPRS